MVRWAAGHCESRIEYIAVAKCVLFSQNPRRVPVSPDTLKLCAQGQKRLASRIVAGVGLEVDAIDVPYLKRLAEQKELCLEIDTGPLRRASQPGASDLDRVGVKFAITCAKVQGGGRAHHSVVSGANESEWNHLASRPS